MLNGHTCGFDFLKFFFEIFLLVMVRARYNPSLVFRLSLVLSMVKFSAGIQLFGLKTTSHGKPGPKNSFPRSDLRYGDFRVRFRGRSGYRDTLYSNISLFSAGSQLFGLKTTSHGKPDPKNSIPGSDLRCREVQGEVQGEVGVQGHPVLQYHPVLCGYSTFRDENQFTRET